MEGAKTYNRLSQCGPLCVCGNRFTNGFLQFRRQLVLSGYTSDNRLLAFLQFSVFVFREGDHEFKKVKGIVARFSRQGAEPFFGKTARRGRPPKRRQLHEINATVIPVLSDIIELIGVIIIAVSVLIGLWLLEIGRAHV